MLCELAFADATELAELVARGEVSASELVRASIARIEALNPRLNAVVTPMYEQALAAAEQVDPNAPFAGVPLLVKDLLACCAGMRNTNGSRLLAENVAGADSELVVRLRRAGLVPVGLTSTSELGRAPITEGGLFGATRNPWDTELSTAGSSGGSAAAVAAGIVPLAHGNDTGGSLRNPASCCGVFALKPSRGRMPNEPSAASCSRACWSSTRSRARCATARACSTTRTGRCPASPIRRPRARRARSQQALSAPAPRLRIAVSTQTLTGEQPDPQCVAAVEHAARVCAELGHELVDDAPRIEDGAALVRRVVRGVVGGRDVARARSPGARGSRGRRG